MREDLRHTYVVMTTGETAIWLTSRSCIYHATVDGLRAVCNRAILVYEDGAGHGEDRSDSVMTCVKCQERVRRVKEEGAKIDVDAALRRHRARELGVDERDLS
jgi:hypothetical protein